MKIENLDYYTEQMNVLKPGNVVIIYNARVDMFQRCMRLKIDKRGSVQSSGEVSRFFS